MSETTKNRWNSNFGYLMVMTGAAIGLGNIWRFPYVLYSNGGWSFLIPYIIAVLILGFSFSLLEHVIGYRFKKSFINIFYKIKPKFEYLAWFILLTIFLIVLYHATIIGWDLIYLFLSFFKGWGSDPNLFFANDILMRDDSLNGLFLISPLVFMGTCIAWVIIWLISHKNINKGISKISKILVPLLFIMVTIFVLYSLTLPGASMGYKTMFSPDWNVLLNLDVWIAAFGQTLFSLSLGVGILITYSSYLPKGAKLVKNTFIVLIINSGFEIFNTIGIFSILGFMGIFGEIQLYNIISQGKGIAFIALPQVFNAMGDVAYILGPMFFLCILFVGIISIISLIEPFTHSISEKFDFSRKKSTTLICTIGFLASMVFSTGFGSYLLIVYDSFLNNVALILGIVLECVIFGWFYSIDDLMDLLNENSFIKIGNWWKNIVKYVLPVVLSILLIKGAYDNILTSSIEENIIVLILVLILVIIPLILTNIKKKDSSAIS
ncbi:MAG: sodium-dependent transporter [Methanobacteriaceae archaeon]|nr:sodium-dependent transporter [Methanobacteriaceae archaeon]